MKSLPDNILVPSALDRQKIFHLLKKWSSFTGWNRIFGYYSKWAVLVEESFSAASVRGWAGKTGIAESHYVTVLQCLAHCEAGITRLRAGDKRIFKYDANGEFQMAYRALSFWSDMLYRIDTGENGIDFAHTPLWQEFKAATVQLKEAWEECAPYILEQQYLDRPARLLYGKWLRDRLAAWSFPEELDEPPDPYENVIVRSGDSAPCSGIWEPVDVDGQSNGKFSLLPASTPNGFIQPVGCMNYLHAESPAPTAKLALPNETFESKVSWRLLWKDERYGSQDIPPEEAAYHFLAPLVPLQKAGSIIANTNTVVWEISGRPAPVGGKWLVEADLNAAVTLQQGQLLPLHDGREVRWVLAS